MNAGHTCARGVIIDVQEFNKAKEWTHSMGHRSVLEKRCRPLGLGNRLILVRHGDLMTIHNNVLP